MQKKHYIAKELIHLHFVNFLADVHEYSKTNAGHPLFATPESQVSFNGIYIFGSAVF